MPKHRPIPKNRLLTAACAAVFLWVLFTGCRQKKNTPGPGGPLAGTGIPLSEVYRYQHSLLPKMRQQIKTGDLITRMGKDMTSYLFAKINRQDQSFSHCGIASIEHDTIWIYHALGGEFNPNQKMLREPLQFFAHPQHCKKLGIFRPTLDILQLKNLQQHLANRHAQGMPFDMDFDLQTDDRQYCAEMVAKSYATALGVQQWVTPVQTGTLTYISIESLYLHPQVREIARYTYAAP